MNIEYFNNLTNLPNVNPNPEKKKVHVHTCIGWAGQNPKAQNRRHPKLQISFSQCMLVIIIPKFFRSQISKHAWRQSTKLFYLFIGFSLKNKLSRYDHRRRKNFQVNFSTQKIAAVIERRRVKSFANKKQSKLFTALFTQIFFWKSWKSQAAKFHIVWKFKSMTKSMTMTHAWLFKYYSFFFSYLSLISI